MVFNVLGAVAELEGNQRQYRASCCTGWLFYA